MLKTDELTSRLVELIKRGPRVDQSSLNEILDIPAHNTSTTVLKLALMAYDLVQRGALVEKE